jgi:GAF domain-containing protein
MRTAEEELRRVTRALRVLSAGNRGMVRAAGEQELYEDICQSISDSAGYPLAWIGLAEPDDHRSVRRVAESGPGAPYLKGIEVSWGEGLWATARFIRSGQMIAVNDAANDARFQPWREGARSRAASSSSARSDPGGVPISRRPG